MLRNYSQFDTSCSDTYLILVTRYFRRSEPPNGDVIIPPWLLKNVRVNARKTLMRTRPQSDVSPVKLCGVFLQFSSWLSRASLCSPDSASVAHSARFSTIRFRGSWGSATCSSRSLLYFWRFLSFGLLSGTSDGYNS